MLRTENALGCTDGRMVSQMERGEALEGIGGWERYRRNGRGEKAEIEFPWRHDRRRRRGRVVKDGGRVEIGMMMLESTGRQAVDRRAGLQIAYLLRMMEGPLAWQRCLDQMETGMDGNGE
jgi:hypothetical protein